MEGHRKHIFSTKATKDNNGIETSFCGESISMEFHFINIDHAVINIQNKGRLATCIQCKNAVIKILNNKK